MNPDEYDAWYRSTRGRWIGATEFRLLLGQLGARPGCSVLDVGCGSGYFTRRLSEAGLEPVGIDADAAMIRYARARAQRSEPYLVGDARSLPFRNGQFEYAVAITSLCFVADVAQALRELARVTQRSFAVGLLNRHSLLYLQKGRRGGRGAYRGARWHSVREVRALFGQSGLALEAVRTAIHLPGAGPVARWFEQAAGQRLRTGAFLLALGSGPRSLR